MGDIAHRPDSKKSLHTGGTRRKAGRLLLLTGALCCAFAILAAAASARLAFWELDEGRMRVDFNTLVNEAEQGALHAAPNVGYALFDTAGNVTQSTLADYPGGKTIDPRTLSGQSGVRTDGDYVTFLSPVMHGGTLGGLLLVKAPKSAYLKMNPPWLAVFVLAFLLAASTVSTLLFTFRMMKKELFGPLGMLHDATRRMLHGDLNARLRYDSDNEAGALCHDFEAMRDELAAAFRRERELLDNDRLLYACVSHDLKTPLAAISGYAEELRDGMADRPDRVSELASLMLKRARLLARLIDDILEETQMQLGELAVVREELYAPGFFEEVCGELSPGATRAGLAFTVGSVPDVLLSIDRGRITQVMQNLVSNSVKYTPRGGRIDIRFSVEGGELVVGVKDNGCGIAAGDIPYIFNRFYRGDAARGQDIPGSGLGLCIAKGIVDRHGGRIECDSVSGIGTEICFSLPL